MTKEEFLQNAEACIREYGGNANVEEILLRKFIKESGREKARLYKERMVKYQPSYCAHWDFLEKAFLAGAIEAFKYETAAKRKDLLGIPWMLAFALRDFGWYLRQDIIWHKSNPMPESVTDRCTRAHEYVFLFSKRSRYYFMPMLEDAEGYDGRKATATRGSAKYRGKRVPGNSQQSIVQGGERWRFKNLHRSNPNTLHLRRLTGGGQELYPVRNRRDVWKLNAARSPYAHYATYPLELIEPCLLATCPQGGVVLDPFMGSGTTAVAAAMNNRHYIGFDINSEYVEIANRRITDEKSKKEIEL